MNIARLTDEDEIPNATTASAMQEARQGCPPTFQCVADLMANLNAEDVEDLC